MMLCISYIYYSWPFFTTETYLYYDISYLHLFLTFSVTSELKKGKGNQFVLNTYSYFICSRILFPPLYGTACLSVVRKMKSMPLWSKTNFISTIFFNDNNWALLLSKHKFFVLFSFFSYNVWKYHPEYINILTIIV